MSGFAQGINVLFFNLRNIEDDEVNVTVSQCEETIDHYSFYQGFLIPAVLITLSFGFTQHRRKLFLEILNGRPGMVFPMDIMTRDTSMSYAAAFGATLHLVFLVIFEQKTAFVSHGPEGLKKIPEDTRALIKENINILDLALCLYAEGQAYICFLLVLLSLIVIISMIVYGLVYFPIFACLAIRSTYGYIMGSLYIWSFSALSFYQELQCAYVYERNTMIVLVCRSIPQFGCLLYLCISIPGRCYEAFKTKKNIFETISEDYVSETLSDIKDSYLGRHVRKLFIKPPPKPELPEDFKGKMIMKLKMFWNRCVYKRDDGFEYSSRFQSVVFVGILLIYMLSFEFLVNGIALFRFASSIIDQLIEIELQEGDLDDVVESLKLLLYFAKAFQISFILAIVFTIFVNLISILHTMTSYRKNLRDLHKGIHKQIPAADKRSNSSLLIGSMRYAGYQVGYIAWGFVIQAFIFLVLSMIISTLIILLRADLDEWFISLLMRMWPVILSAVIINVLQILLAKFLFLQEKGARLAFENRRFLFSFTYFMFFYNIFLGLVSCLLRIVKAIVLGAILLSRLDNSTLPHKFQFFDPGFAAYVGFMHIENSHNHPVVLVFVRILLARRRSKMKSALICLGRDMVSNIEGGTGTLGRSGLSEEETRKRKSARFNWHVTYTLINNPELRLYRKGYLYALKKAKENGYVIPVSDNFSTDLSSLIQLQKPKMNNSNFLKNAKHDDPLNAVSRHQITRL